MKEYFKEPVSGLLVGLVLSLFVAGHGAIEAGWKLWGNIK